MAMAILPAIALLALAAQPSTPELPATYSNVCLSRETGDQGGVELTLLTREGAPVVILKTCEGGCWRQATREVKLADGRIAFLATYQTFTREGAVAETLAHRFTGVVRGRTLVLDSPGYYGRQVLKRVPVPAGLNDKVGPDPSTWPMAIRRCG